MTNWEEIHPDFTKELVKEWEEKRFSKEECKKWIEIGDLKPTEVDFAEWLRDIKNFGPKGFLDSRLREEYSSMKILFEAAEENNFEAIRELIKEKKVSINAHDIFGNTPLHYAVAERNLEAIEVILELKAQVNSKGKDDLTPLHIAVTCGQRNIVEKLLEHEANPNALSLTKNTPLHFAAENNSLEILKLLVKKGGNINSRNKYGWSILHSAASGILDTSNTEENWGIIRWLLKKGADVDVKTESGLEIGDVFLEKDSSYVERYEELIKEWKKTLQAEIEQR